jgi:hypothetical protein
MRRMLRARSGSAWEEQIQARAGMAHTRIASVRVVSARLTPKATGRWSYWSPRPTPLPTSGDIAGIRFRQTRTQPDLDPSSQRNADFFLTWPTLARLSWHEWMEGNHQTRSA